MCSSAVTSDWSVICSSELSVICSSKNVVRSLYSPSLHILRQGSFVLLLKISMVRMKKLIALLSHGEAFAVLLLKVAECSGQLPSKPARLLQACRNKHCSARHKRVHAASFDALWRLRCPKID